MGFDPCNLPLNIQQSIRTPTPKMGVHLGMWGFIPSHSFTLSRTLDVTPGLPSWPTTLQTLALVVNPRLRLRHQINQMVENASIFTDNHMIDQGKLIQKMQKTLRILHIDHVNKGHI
jgi:hypothetical protein